MEQVSAHTQWMLDNTGVPAPVNQIMLYGGVNLMSGGNAGECYLILGHGMPPIVDTARLAPGESVFVPIVPVGQYAVSVERLKEFHSVIGDFLSQQDQIPG